MSDIESRLRSIQKDRARGASQLAGDGLDLLMAAAQAEPCRKPNEFIEEAWTLAARLLTIRPSMAAIGNWALFWWQALSIQHGDVLAVSAELTTRRQADQAALRKAAIDALDGANTVLTLSYSSTVEQILSGAAGVERVVIGEGRPRYEGRRLAEVLESGGQKVELITDAALALFAQRVDHVLLGADSITSDFAVINKVGSLAAVLGAESAGVPCLVAADSFKLDPIHTAETISFEEMAAEEVWCERPELCRNIYFEPLPASLIGAYVTEQGVKTAAELAPELDRWRALHAKFNNTVKANQF